MQPESIGQLKTRTQNGGMVQLSSLLNARPSNGPDRVQRYNSYVTADINGGPAPGFSSGQAQAAISKILDETLPKGIGYEWTDLTYQQILAGNTMVYVFPLCVLLAFLVLAAQYESLRLPLAVILIVPMCVLFAILGVWLTVGEGTILGIILAILGANYPMGDNNIFTQIAFIVLVGLACKNAILIVEFARELEREGKNAYEAAMTACRLRLRPILMTSFAFIMGVVPLVLANGAGAEMRQAIGIAVFFGMLGVTLFGLFLTPVFYVLLRSGAKPMSCARRRQPWQRIEETIMNVPSPDSPDRRGARAGRLQPRAEVRATEGGDARTPSRRRPLTARRRRTRFVEGGRAGGSAAPWRMVEELRRSGARPARRRGHGREPGAAGGRRARAAVPRGARHHGGRSHSAGVRGRRPVQFPAFAGVPGFAARARTFLRTRCSVRMPSRATNWTCSDA